MPVSISGDGIISGVSTLTTGNFVTTQSISAPTATFTGNVSIGGTLTYEDVTNIDSIGIITARSGVIVTGVTTVSAGTTSAPSITPTGDSNTGVFFPSADTIAFAEGGVEAARFDSSGNLIVGTTSLASGFSGFAQIEASGTTGGVLINSATNNIGRLIFTNNNINGGEGLIRYDGSDKSMQFWTNATQKAVIDTSGNFTIANGNLVFSTAGTGINFSATANSSGTMTSELLSDYEEGTWTPTLPNGGSIAVTGAAYTRIGRFVSVFAYMSAISPTNNSSDFRIGGLPYTNIGSGNYHTGSIGFTGFGNLNDWRPIVAVNDTYVYFHIVSGNNAPRTNANYVTLNNGSPLLFNVTYYTS